MKKILATALALTLTFGTFALPAVQSGVCLADKFAVSASAETYGDYEYGILYDGTVGITGYSGDSETITIPSTINGKKVTSIGIDAFSYCTSLISIIIPDSVTSIEYNAFYNCTSLASITIPDSVTNIGECAFYGCTSLASITIPDSVTSIREGTFSGCTSLVNITIPNSVTSICDGVFSGCTGLKNIIVDSKNECYSSKDGVLFNKNKTNLIKYPGGNNRTSYNIPDSVIIVDWGAFSDCTILTDVVISDSVTDFGGAFYNCKSLENITISDSVIDIARCAFLGCTNLKNITMPNSITSIGEYAFSGCTSLTSFIVDPDNENYSSKDGVLFDKEQTELIKYPVGHSRTAYNIPDSVTIIDENAFDSCNNLTSIIIPKSVDKIKNNAFAECNGLKDVYYAGSQTEWNNMSKGNNRSLLENATIHYNSTGDIGTDISNCTVSIPTNTQYFRGIRIKPVVTVKDGSTVLKYGTDYKTSYTNNLSVGKASVEIIGIGKYSGSVTKNFDIVERSITNCNIILDAETYNFTGSRLKPTFRVYTNGIEMYSGNYTVAYSNNLSVGTATITLTGKKNLKGTVTKTFNIAPRNIASCTVELTKNSANKYQPTVAVKLGSNSVYNGNYTVKYTTSADKKTVKVTLTGKGNLAGSVIKTYTVA